MVSGRIAGFKHSAATIAKISAARKAKPMISQYISTDGYVMVYCPSHPYANRKGYVREHRLIMESILGRYLLPEEAVHHKGINFPLGSIENKRDNKGGNLQYFATESAHQAFHELLKKQINPNYNQKVKD